MRRLAAALTATALAAAAFAAPAGAAQVGFEEFDVTFTGPDGLAMLQAGSHPTALTVKVQVNTEETPSGNPAPVEAVRDLKVFNVPGLAGIPTAVPRCSTVDFLAPVESNAAGCSDSSAVGLVNVQIGGQEGLEEQEAPVYSLDPPPGSVAKFGFWALTVPVTVDLGVSEAPPYNVVATTAKVSQVLEFFSAEFTVWGTPADPIHDEERGNCYEGGASCPATIPIVPLLTSPRACNGPLPTVWEIDSWENPDVWVSGAALTHDDAVPPNPEGFSGCGRLDFGPRMEIKPSTDQASSPAGADIELDVEDEGLANPLGLAASDIKKTVLTLPEGVTLNPSLAEGIVACSEEDLARLHANSPAGTGCPPASKVGSVEVESPSLPGEILGGSLYVATPFENPFDSLIAVYMVVQNPELGVLVRQPIKVEADPKTGQIVNIVDEIPQFPLSHVRVHLREGGRSPLISPSGCGSYTTKADLTPWAAPDSTYTTTSTFQITQGVGGGPCPAAGPPPFEPGFSAGAINNSAGAYSPFFMRITRRDGDQDITRLSVKLPRGVLGKLAGVSKCSDAAIAAAKAKTGKQEQANPSCPANSQVGSAQGGAGVGSQLTYVPGKLYLAGPIGGAPLSVVGIVPAVAGPFDVGNVVVREALRINPRTVEVEADGTVSDPFPYILAGIPLKVRDIQVAIDRPNFTLNPTSCAPSEARAKIWGGGLDLFSSADDVPVSLASRFQAASCASLGFKPALTMRLKGATHRGAHPALRATYTPRPGDANVSGAIARLPRSAFLDQAHIRTICTRVQFAANNCPPGAVYGHAKAFSPLVDEPFQGPIYLRSSNHNLPDLVAVLHGIVDVEAVARIDSQRGGIRVSFEETPDAPLDKVIFDFPGGKKGLIVNSRELCAHRSFANIQLSAHNGRQSQLRTLVKASCGTQSKKSKKSGG
jgi:hypothetical protein